MFSEQFTPSERKVLGIMLSDPFKEYSLSTIQKKSKISYMSVFRAIKYLEESEIVEKSFISGKSFRSLNFENKRLLKLLEMIEITNQISLKEKKYSVWEVVSNTVENVAEKLKENLLIAVLLTHSSITGLKDNSDLGMVFVVSNSKEEAEGLIKENLSMYPSTKIFPIVITLDEFIFYLRENGELGKALLGERTVFYGEGLFWREMIRGVRD